MLSGSNSSLDRKMRQQHPGAARLHPEFPSIVASRSWGSESDPEPDAGGGRREGTELERCTTLTVVQVHNSLWKVCCKTLKNEVILKHSCCGDITKT